MIQNGLCRTTINRRISRIKHLFRWAASEELVSPTVYQGMMTVTGLQRGRTTAPERPRVKPVPREVVDATLPFLRPQAADLVRLLLLTGARAGELVGLRTRDLDCSGEVWTHLPAQHKNAHRDQDRTIYFGPQAQVILQPWLRVDAPEAFLFSPWDSEQQRNRDKRAARLTPMTPSHARRGPKAHRRRAPRDRYSTCSLRRAIARACDRAFPSPLAKQKSLTTEQRAELRQWRKRHRWHPHQLRHLRASEIRKVAGLDAARVILGHSSLLMSDHYAELDRQQAVQVVRKTG